MGSDLSEDFLADAKEWLCSGYHVLIRYIGLGAPSKRYLASACIYFQPTPWPFHSFEIETDDLSARQKILENITRTDALKIIKSALGGKIANIRAMGAKGEFYLEPDTDEQWQRLLSAKVSWVKEGLSSRQVRIIEGQLRRCDIPFDGLQDLCNWLELDKSNLMSQKCVLDLRITPPAAIAFAPTAMADGRLNLLLRVHNKLAQSLVHVGVTHFPGNPATSRFNATSKITWGPRGAGHREGKLLLDAPQADRALVMLTVGSRTAQRQWFGDPAKAVNKRFLAASFFDPNLSALQNILLNAQPAESRKFEHAVVSLLFLMGYSATTQLEPNAPDIIATTPLGRVILIECTLKIQDFRNKLGKLYERKKALSEALEKGNHDARVHAFLVCGAPRSQVVVEDQLLLEHQIGLLCKEDIQQALSTLRTPGNPDNLLDNFSRRAFGDANP